MALLLKLEQDKKLPVISLELGSASTTIAKTMSAYDKDFSDAIYGKEKNKDMFVRKDYKKC